MEVDGVFQLFDHGQHLRAGFHVVVGVFKDLLDDLVLWALAGVDLVFEGGEQFIIDEADQFAAGDLWFLLIYIAFAHRLNMEYNLAFEPWIYIAVIITSAVSHWNQASITDYYKTLHLLFISKDKGKEFESSASVSERYALMRPGVNKVITWGYIFYTKNQERLTPQLQKLMALIRVKYGKDIPEGLRVKLHDESLKLMTLMNFNTFNGRSLFLFISAVFNVIWLYFVWEIIVLNIIRVVIVKRHERFCKDIAKTI